MQLVKEVYASWRAEVVFITSNRQGNQEIMEGCKEAGIPAFVSQAHYLRLMASDFRRGFRERCGTSNEMSSASTIIIYSFYFITNHPYQRRSLALYLKYSTLKTSRLVDEMP